MSQRDLFLVRPVPRRIVHPGFADRLLFAPVGSLLVGGHGTLGEGEIFGRTVRVTPSLSRAGLTQDLLRIQPKPEFSEIAYAFLSSDLGFRLLRTTAVGTKLLSMRPDLLLDLPFPDVPDDVAKSVRDAVSAAQSARAEADAAEAEAIRIVEEEVLPQWLA
jgi:type I restriction enzyme S subunit